MTAEPGTLADAIGASASTFVDIQVERDAGTSRFLTRGMPFATVDAAGASFLLPPDVGRGALGTPDTAPSSLGAGWIRFTPGNLDRFAVDRAQAWFVLAHRSAGQRTRGSRRLD